jgi:hypothetical protein
MQVQLNDIAGGKRLLGQVREEEFVDHACARHADGFLLVLLLLPVLVSRVRCYHDAAGHACGAHWDRWTIVEAAHGLAFRALLAWPCEHGQKIDDLVVPHAPSRTAYPFADFGQDIMLAKITDEQHDFAKPARGRGLGSEVVWIFTELSAILVMPTSLLRTVVFVLFKEAYFYADLLPATPRCASRGRNELRIPL